MPWQEVSKERTQREEVEDWKFVLMVVASALFAQDIRMNDPQMYAGYLSQKLLFRTDFSFSQK